MRLELKGIRKKYGSVVALHRIDLSLETGVYALLGPNGAGKSTMMNLITGILAPTEGEILFDGISIGKMGKAYREILSYMPQQQGMYETFTAARFLSYIGALKGISSREVEREVDRVLDLVNLSSMKHCYIGAMSGGMKQRLLIAQAMMKEPKILILDEPTAGLDPKERIRIRNIISQVARDKIVLFATHVVSDIEHLAKHVIFLKKGRRIAPVESPLDFCREFQGRVYEILVQEEELQEIEKRYPVSGVAQAEEGIVVRLITQEPPVNHTACPVFPTLDDVYLHYFQEEREDRGVKDAGI